MPVVDGRVHLTRIHFPAEGVPRDYTLTVEQLVSRMDREGIDLAVLPPLESPDAFFEYYLTACGSTSDDRTCGRAGAEGRPRPGSAGAGSERTCPRPSALGSQLVGGSSIGATAGLPPRRR
ncbi:MAG TPA: hypothetical protein VGM69_15170 [Chloroflexota bacterium]|jgi:hypothetical protein